MQYILELKGGSDSDQQDVIDRIEGMIADSEIIEDHPDVEIYLHNPHDPECEPAFGCTCRVPCVRCGTEL